MEIIRPTFKQLLKITVKEYFLLAVTSEKCTVSNGITMIGKQAASMSMQGREQRVAVGELFILREKSVLHSEKNPKNT